MVIDVITTQGGYIVWQVLRPCVWLMELPQVSIYFKFSSEMLSRTSSHMWGRWYLPIFLLRDGLFALMYRASFMVLKRFWSSLLRMFSLFSEWETCMHIKEWMDMNQLKINMSKTEFIRFGNQRQLDKCTTNSLKYDSETIDQVDCVKNFGVLMDRTLSYSKHIRKKCEIAYHNLKNIRQLRGDLNEQNVTQLKLALVISHLDFSNSLLTGLPNKVYKVMQKGAEYLSRDWYLKGIGRIV